MWCRRFAPHNALGRNVLVLLIAAAATAAGRAEIPDWVRDVETGGRFHDALFRMVMMPGGQVEVRRAPAEAREALTAAAPADAADREWLALRARAAEEMLDAAAAEADWKAYADAASDRAAGQLALADFYHRRLQPQKEADALAAAAQAPDPDADAVLPVAERRSWRTFARLFALIGVQQLPDVFAEAQYRAWIAGYPEEPEPYDRLFRFLLALDRPADAEALLARYAAAFPGNDARLLKARAELAVHRGAIGDALAVYDRAFDPLWNDAVVRDYFELLAQTHSLRAFLDRARAGLAARPDDLAPVARVFYYYQREGNSAAAEQALADFEARRGTGNRTAAELFTLARLYEKTRNVNEALRYDAAVYSLPGASAADVERALAGVIGTLLAAPEQPFRFGLGDLSFYRDVGRLDPNPGFLNGVLSLLLNSASPRYQFAQEERSAVPYFHRARAADLLALFETRFPASPRRAALNAALIAAYAAYGESNAVVGRGRTFLAAFPDAPQRTGVAFEMADAFARTEQVSEELAIYDRLLQELGARAGRVPLGENAVPAEAGAAIERQRAGVRSQEYARVLDRYIARLVSQRRLGDALQVYRREIDRNPNDPGLYAAAAQFLEQNNFAAEVEDTYRRAMQQFPDRSWHHRLARWFLRRRQAAAFQALTEDVTRTFAGSDLARYFAGVVNTGPSINAQLFLQLNRYAHDRFPHHLLFVRNLLMAYSTRETLDLAAYDALLRRHWFEDPDLSAQFFATLTRTNRLAGEIESVRSGNAAAADRDWSRLAKENPAAARFLAEADIWQSRFELAAPLLAAVAAEYPGDDLLGHRAGSLHRSLSDADAREIEAAVAAEQRLARYNPRDAATLTTLGEIYADREQYDRARAFWDRLPAIEPGSGGGYLESATIFWDYFRFDDALRVIEEGRRKLRTPSLYAYEAGAIDEGLRQPARAVDEYVKGALSAPESEPARRRLLVLARRPAYRNIVDRASAAAAEGNEPPAQAVALRIALLEAQDRRPDLERFLVDLLDRTSSLELMTAIETQAARLGFDSVRTRSLTRQIETMSDPVDKLQLRCSLVRLYEARGELEVARRTLQAVYDDHPRILGIVRQTVDYYWRHDLRREAVDVLVRAASESHPGLKPQFTFEAAAKAIQMSDYARGRGLLRRLLADDPFNADYLAAMADSFAAAREDAQLRDFYRSTIEAMRSAPLPPDERTRRIAGLRRGLIPALTRLNDHAGAIDQYIEIINRFPDDEAVLREAGRYARRHARTAQLVDYYRKTAADSPRDYRWPMLLARLETEFEDFTAAIDAYNAASAIRPDRADFAAARGALRERLLQFDAAIGDYRKAFDLTYRDRQWMEKIAELHARQGRIEDAARAVREALVEGRPVSAAPLFAAARRLDGLNMLGPARSFVDEAAALADPADLLEQGSAYVSVYTRLRQPAAVFDRLVDALGKASARGGNLVTVQNAFLARLAEMGDIVARDFTPEEKVDVAAFLAQRKQRAQPGDVATVLLPVAERAGLADLAVEWRSELAGADPDGAMQHIARIVDLQTSRLQFADLAGRLERFAGTAGPNVDQLRFQAAETYRKAGDPAGELRVLSRIPAGALSIPLRSRYFELLLARDPGRLMTLARSAPSYVRDAAAEYVVVHGTADQALAAIRARGQGLPPVWTNAYTALVGLHLARFDETTTAAFRTVLGPVTVGEQLKAIDRSARLAGNVWFAYGSRFGEYLAAGRLPGAEDYLAAELERTPARSDPYAALGDFYRDRGASSAALADYRHAATLNARRVDIHLRAASILLRQGQRSNAIDEWREALRLLAAQVGGGADETAPRVAALDAIAGHALLAELKEPADRMARAYIARNGAYRADALMRAAFRAAGDNHAGTTWLIDLMRAAPNQIEALSSVARATWLPNAERDRVFERIVVVAEEAVAGSHGAAQAAARDELHRWSVQRIRSLVETKQPVHAGELLRALPAGVRDAQAADVTELEARIAAGERTLDTLLDRYRRDETRLPDLAPLQAAASALRRGGDSTASRQIMEFVYTRQIERDDITPPVLLGLAEIRLQQGDLAAALDLLRRLTLVAGEPFVQVPAAAALLERLNHRAEALEFRRARARAVPWDGSAQIDLARTELAAASEPAAALERLRAVVESSTHRYQVRVNAAQRLASAGARLDRAPRTELDWLRAPGDLTPAEAGRPMFVAARVAAAQRAADAAVRADLLLAAVAVAPGDTSLRVPLFRAQLAAARPAAAIEALEPILRRSRSLTNIGLTSADRARLARELGEAHLQVDRLQDAARFFTIALEGQTAAARTALRQRIATINQEIGRRAANAARQPRISEELDQPQRVRPRIPPRAVATARAALVAQPFRAANGALR